MAWYEVLRQGGGEVGETTASYISLNAAKATAMAVKRVTGIGAWFVEFVGLEYCSAIPRTKRWMLIE